ncbi:HTH domain-containing protein [Bradyrhizobium roseum]|uniref:HTH domain-containing protein n=1 Tax=Bradyrhizobium roseum TaxID=3056648 RepID=UPI00262EAFA8|nr:restriction endonuclease [Bradyrhizobium roseus]WKA27961.1 restriction endonuclease [Bradyrhizobium roseus]
MSGYTPTHIGIPKNHADFERKCVVLFQELLEDPSVKRLGRSGQSQYGIDLLGYRKGNTKKLVGIQCKKKQPNKALTTTEVRTEVRRALKYKPQLSEYIIVTTGGDDTELDKLATALTKQQRERGRRVRIQVWGWETLEDYIDRYPAAKEAFDPGASPAVKEVKGKLDRITKRLKAQPTAQQISDQFASLTEKVERRTSIDDDRLPTAVADRELASEVSRINRRRGFIESKTADEFSSLAQRILNGDLAKASYDLQADSLERAARSNVSPENVDRAKVFHAEALKRKPGLDTSFYDALLPSAVGHPNDTLRALRRLDTCEARSALFGQLTRNDGTKKALQWAKSLGVGVADLDAGGALNLLLQRIGNDEYDAALRDAELLSEAQLNALPALYMIRSGLLLSSILPKDQRHIPFQGVPINPKMLQFNSLESTPATLVKARLELETALSVVSDLKLVQIQPLLEEQILWLRLEDPTKYEAARQQIEREIKDPKHTLSRVRLALAYGIPFNQEALKRRLTAEKEFGNWTNEEQFAAFLLAWHSEDLSELADFFDTYRSILYEQKPFDLVTLLGIELEALSRIGRFDDARVRLAEKRGSLVDDENAARMEDLIASLEKGDEVERLRKLFESTGELNHLRLLIALLVSKRDHRQLASYAPQLLKESQRVEDYDISQKALFADGQYKQVLELAQGYPELHKLRDDFMAVEGWSYFYLGRTLEARTIARALVSRREDSGDRELDINTAIESGDWSYLQAIVAREASRIDMLDAKLLIRLARIAFESGSLYVDKFRDAAIEREPDSPEILVAAYHLSIERGEEYQETRAHEWLQKAVELSTEDGPIQSVKLKDVVDRTSGWNKRVDDIEAMLAGAQVPLYMAARGLNRKPVEFILGTALRNARSSDTRHQFPVLAFSGSRALFDLSGVRRLALDNTSIFTLEFLGLLQKIIDAFDQIIISPATLSSLFTDRQSIRFRQPSEVKKARKIKKLLADGRLKTLRMLKTDAEVAALDIDPDLQTLLDKARETKGVVVRSAPVHKLRSFLEEEADLASYSDVLTDTLAALALVQNKITAPTESNASTYLSQVDKGWKAKAPLNKSTTAYLDQLSVTYLNHVGILDAFISSVATVYVPEEIEVHCDAVLRGEESSSDLLNSVERIRTTLNAALDKGSVSFSSRRISRRESTDSDDDEPSVSFPSLDILSNLSDIDAIAADDRFLNKEAAWSDGSSRIPCVSTLEIIAALNSRGIISESQKYSLLNRLREGGYYAVPVDAVELLDGLGRSSVEDGKLVEARELVTIRENLTIALRSRMHSALETPWVDHTRLIVHQSLRSLWSDESSSTSTIPRADWLLAVLPLPVRLVYDAADDARWSAAFEKTSALMGLMLSPPAVSKGRQVEYSDWVEARLAAPARAKHPAMLDRAIAVLSEFYRRMIEAEGEIPIGLRKRFVAEMAMNLHANIERQLVETDEIAAAIGIKTTPVITLNGTHSVVVESFVAALRLAMAGRKSAKIERPDGTKTDVKLQFVTPNAVMVTFDNASFTFAEADVLSNRKAGRKRALKRVFSQKPLTRSEESLWLDRAEAGAFTAVEYTELLGQLRETPENVIGALSGPQTLNSEKLIPRDLSYYTRLVGPVQKHPSFADYIADEQNEHRKLLLERGPVGLRRLAYSAISRPLIPFGDLEALPLSEIAKLTTAADPFSLMFGFEVCQDRFSNGEKAAAKLGTTFLKKLLADEKWLQSRLEVFSACAVIGTVTLRPVANEPSPPLSWYRMAVLSHAGVLTTALAGLTKTDKFFEWSARDFGSTYLWHTALDARHDPRWESEWISPEALRAELIGRCYNALMLLPSDKRPKDWTVLIDEALSGLDTKLFAFFPGPLDGFLPLHSPIQAEAAFNEVRLLLKGRSSFKRAPGIILLAYGGAIDARLKDEIFRLLEASNEQLAKLTTADQVLRSCAYIAAINRDEELATAVVTRCLRLISPQTKPDVVLRIFLISMKACAAHPDPSRYYREAATVATRFAYAAPLDAAHELRTVLEEMKCRDPRLAGSFGRAEAILEVALGSV